MKTSLDQKRKNRFLLLRKLYEKTDGVADRHLLDIRKIGKEIKLDPDVALDTFEYLKGEGLTKWRALGGVGTITHWGIKEVEDAFEQKETAHFPANIVILTNSPGANVVSSSGDQSYQGASIYDQRGQTYEAGQVGAQGPNAHAHDMTFNQVWNQNKEKIDLTQLSKELSTLRETLSQNANSPEEFIEIGNIANAEVEAKGNNGSKALEYLAKVGKWSFNTATLLGVAVAANAIKIAAGQ